jgi:hypothetical protein
MNRSDKCMNYQQRQDFVSNLAARTAREIMSTHPIDRIGIIAELPKRIEAAMKRFESAEEN